MRNSWRILALLAVIFACQMLSASAALSEPIWAGWAGWSSHATHYPYSENKQVRIPAPNNDAALVLEKTGFRVVLNGQTLPRTDDAGVGTMAEVLWSPDSKAFVITQSEGGGVGWWYTLVYVIDDDQLKTVDVNSLVIKACKPTYQCAEPQDPEIGAIKWLDGSKNLVLACEVPPHSNCGKMMGRLRGYVIDISSGRITKKLNERQLRSKYRKDLGRRLRLSGQDIGIPYYDIPDNNAASKERR